MLTTKTVRQHLMICSNFSTLQSIPSEYMPQCIWRISQCIPRYIPQTNTSVYTPSKNLSVYPVRMPGSLCPSRTCRRTVCGSKVNKFGPNDRQSNLLIMWLQNEQRKWNWREKVKRLLKNHYSLDAWLELRSGCCLRSGCDRRPIWSPYAIPPNALG